MTVSSMARSYVAVLYEGHCELLQLVAVPVEKKS